MAAGDGNGWVHCRCGRRHWGLHGAAGLLLGRPVPDDPPRAGADGAGQVLLQLRATWTHEGGTWGLPGGAVDSHEDALAGALREAHEETGVPPTSVRVLGSVLSTDHVDWTYHVVLGVPAAPVRPHPTTAESDDVRWFSLDDVARLPLHPGFAVSWPGLLGRVQRMLADRGARRG